MRARRGQSTQVLAQLENADDGRGGSNRLAVIKKVAKAKIAGAAYSRSASIATPSSPPGSPSGSPGSPCDGVGGGGGGTVAEVGWRRRREMRAGGGSRETSSRAQQCGRRRTEESFPG